MSQRITAVSFTLALLTFGCSKTDATPEEASPRPKQALPAASAPGTPTVKVAQPKEGAKPAESKVRLHEPLAASVAEVLPLLDAIPAERKKELKKLALFVETKRKSGETAELTFICTHNSRRSHLSQLWAATAAAYYGVDGVKTYSGGTEATAFNPRAVAAIERAGYQVETPEGENPRYQVSFASDAPQQECYSKKYSDTANPQSNFAAVMTCTQADKNCPTVEGAVLRIPLPYVDPKEADDTPGEAAAYDERSKQIASEMFYLFSQVKA